jgi:hypothetical protein
LGLCKKEKAMFDSQGKSWGTLLFPVDPISIEKGEMHLIQN